MKAEQTVYVTQDRSKAVPEGDRRAQFLLVREGQEIVESQYEGIDGAAALIKGKKVKPETEPEPKKIEPLRKKH